MPSINPIQLLIELLTAGGVPRELTDIVRGVSVTSQGLRQLVKALESGGVAPTGVSKAATRRATGGKYPLDLAAILRTLSEGRPLVGPQAPSSRISGGQKRGPKGRITEEPEEAEGPAPPTATGGGKGESGIKEALKLQRVQSSNVFAIGYDYDTGTLRVQYLAGAGKKRHGAGAIYDYYDVTPKIWENFQNASSKGKWIWDHLRIRGTISGHQYEYRLISGWNFQIKVGAAYGRGGSKTKPMHYIPRLASGKGFTKRTRVVGGVKVRSMLPNVKFSEGKAKKYFMGR
jgi:hypothetical protein